MDEIIVLGYGTFISKSGKELYKVSFACKMPDHVGDSIVGYEAATVLCSKDIYDEFADHNPMDTINGIVIRENYQLKIARILD